MATQAQLQVLGQMVARSEQEIFDLPKIERLGEALDYALTLIPGWRDAYISEDKEKFRTKGGYAYSGSEIQSSEAGQPRPWSHCPYVWVVDGQERHCKQTGTHKHNGMVFRVTQETNA